MDIITVRIYKSKSIYLGKDVTDLYGKNWEFQPDVKNRQIKARPSIKTGRVINTGATISIAAIINKIGVEHLFLNRSAVTQVMTMGSDGWFTTSIEHPKTKAQRKIDVKRNAKEPSIHKRKQLRGLSVISLYVKRGKLKIPNELCGKVSDIYVDMDIRDNCAVISASTEMFSKTCLRRKVETTGTVSFSCIQELRHYFKESSIRVQAEYDRGVYTATIKLGSKIEQIKPVERKPIEIEVKPDNKKMTFWQRVKFVFGW
ncbi:MAG: hypothetical protein ACRDC4_16435 [Plesiomonas sp.]